jgi:hypothetical protein
LIEYRRNTMMIRRFAAASALVAVLLAAGCARAADSGNPDSPGAPPVTTAPSPSTADPQPSVPAGQTITGTVSAGVEPNCLLVAGHLLIFDDPALRELAVVGEDVTVVGRADQGMMTTCQEGTPFVVSAVRPN